MATVLGRLLAIAFVVTFLTGLYSRFLQDPLPWMSFPTRPIFLYQLTQGVHVTVGILCFPLILAKLYAVFPQLFQSPPVRSLSHFLERASIALFVAVSLFQITIGLLNTYQMYALFAFPFRQTHYALSFVLIGLLAIHIAVKLDTISKYWRKKDSYDADGNLVLYPEPGDDRSALPEPVSGPVTSGITGRIFAWIDHGRAAPRIETIPDAPADRPAPNAVADEARALTDTNAVADATHARTSRRGFIATVGVASAAIVTLTAGQSFRVLDSANLFAPRKNNTGPNSLPINRTAKAAKVVDSAMAPDWTLTITNGTVSKVYTYDELRAMPQVEVELPIACVEGWSQLATWKGVRMRDLADSVGASPDARFTVTSLEKEGNFKVMTLTPEFARDELTLVALDLNGAPLDIDHGFPARMIAPARPGVRQTKWLSTIEVI